MNKLTMYKIIKGAEDGESNYYKLAVMAGCSVASLFYCLKNNKVFNAKLREIFETHAKGR